MKVADLMTRDVRACTINDSLNAAAGIMWDYDCGCAPVIDGHGKLAGIVTDRDICVAAYTQGLPLAAIPVERVMSAKVITCARGDDLEAAHRLMRTHEIHRLPVVDSRGRLTGILSMSDVIHHARTNHDSPDHVAEIATTFSAIRRRREPAAASQVSSNGGSPAPESSKAPKKAGARRKKPSAPDPR